MRRSVVLFWGTAVGIALAFAATSAALLPYEGLNLHTVAERERAWLLTVWTAGVLAVLLGLTAAVGWRGSLGFREAYEAGSVKAAIERRRQARQARRTEPFHARFDWWMISTGLLLVGIYFIGWLVLRAPP